LQKDISSHRSTGPGSSVRINERSEIMIEREVALRLNDTVTPVRIRVSQFDSMWRFVFTILYQGCLWRLPAGAAAALNGRKPSGNVFAFSGEVEDNCVVVDCDAQMTAEAGSVVCELLVLSGGKVMGTANFILEVEAAAKAQEDVSSESTLPAYGEILDRIAGLETGSAVTVDTELSTTSENPVQNKVVNAALAGKADVSALTTKADLSALAEKADQLTEVTISTAGAVTQALDAGKLYHFTGALTALTVTLNAAASGKLTHYHFDFDSGSTAPTFSLPQTVTMPSGFSVEASKHYEIDILNNYGAVMSW